MEVENLEFVGTVPRLTTDGSRKAYRAFIVKVQLADGSEHTLSHLRYSQFHSLMEHFKQTYASSMELLPAFPSKTLLTPTERVWVERVAQLQDWFRGCLAIPELKADQQMIALLADNAPRYDAMQAVIYNSHGPASELMVSEVPQPAMPLGKDDLFIEVIASSINDTDIRLMAGASDLLHFIGLQSFPFTPGLDVAGIVRGIGSEVTNFQVGEAVIADVGIVRSGCLAEFCVAKSSLCTRKPKNLGFADSAALPHAGLIAYQTLINDLGITKGLDLKKVLILGAHTATGSLSVQIAKHHRCHTVAVVCDGGREWAERMGADQVLVASEVQWWVELAGQQFDAIYDTFGEEGSYEHAGLVLKEKRGVFATQVPEHLRGDPDSLFAWVKQAFQTMGRKIASVPDVKPGYQNSWSKPDGQDLSALVSIVDDGNYKSIVKHSFPLSEIREAFEVAADPNTIGKVVVIVQEHEDNNTPQQHSYQSMSEITSRPPAPSTPVSQPAPARHANEEEPVQSLGGTLDKAPAAEADSYEDTPEKSPFEGLSSAFEDEEAEQRSISDNTFAHGPSEPQLGKGVRVESSPELDSLPAAFEDDVIKAEVEREDQVHRATASEEEDETF